MFEFYPNSPKAPGCWLAACFATCAVLALAAHALSPRGASLELAAQLSPESASGCTFLMTADASDRGAGGRLAGELSAVMPFWRKIGGPGWSSEPTRTRRPTL